MKEDNEGIGLIKNRVVPTRIITTKIGDHIESNELRGEFDEIVCIIINRLNIVKHDVVSIQRVF